MFLSHVQVSEVKSGNVAGKRSKQNETEKSENKDNANNPDPYKDYIHVRARRGQATDSHSIAERVLKPLKLISSFRFFGMETEFVVF